MGKKKRITITAGGCTEIVEYIPVYSGDAPKTRAAKSKCSSEARKIKNAAMSKRNLKFRLAANFMPQRDYFCTLTFAEGTGIKTRSAAEIAVNKFIRRLRDVRRKRGQELKWIYVVEHRHGLGRWHIHFVVNAAGSWREDLEEIESLWGNGTVQLAPLFSGKYANKTWAELAQYMTKERLEDDPQRPKVGTHGYHCSRGLKRVDPTTDWVDIREPVPVPDGVAAEYERRECAGAYFYYVKYELPKGAAQPEAAGGKCRPPHLHRGESTDNRQI